jgi:hypothetical protein
MITFIDTLLRENVKHFLFYFCVVRVQLTLQGRSQCTARTFNLSHAKGLGAQYGCEYIFKGTKDLKKCLFQAAVRT